MKYTIEILRGAADGHEEVLHRTTVEEISPRRTKAKATQLLGGWRHRGASVARVRNHHGEELYRLRET
ncbi:MAG: hypothetical protein ACRECE_05720 [Xanthobacteraceae bacterium]